jgi:superfamily I DNA/RNA helicase
MTVNVVRPSLPRRYCSRPGVPLKDEDNLILSTIHFAKGQEWRAVTLLNAVNGCVPVRSWHRHWPSWTKSVAYSTWRFRARKGT